MIFIGKAIVILVIKRIEMKLSLFLSIVVLTATSNFNHTIEKIRADNEVLLFSSETNALSKEFVGHWKRTAGGSDDNKNRVLDESEKMKLEPGAQDNLQFFSDGKCKVFGMGLEVKGTWVVKNYNGKKTIFVYVDDPEEGDLPQKEK